ncbi:MAG: hypothetical protein HeimC2_42610 [Candidatus Heimdallarchaeota archaeon LC_2]|nr:MAG: hypothetical protein HeimC2_42610 [Candidatus Heimdallarchaeota archaeon LC_2]
MTLRAIRIPINSISTDAVIKWNISDNVGTVLAEGEININEQLYMQQQGSLMIVIGSLQSDDLNNDNKYASGIFLTTGRYKITLSQSLVLDFESKASNTYQGVYSYENDILQNTYPQLYLMGGSHRERSATVNGAASSTFTVSTGTSYVLAYYGDGALSFSPSHELKRIDVSTNSPLTVSMIDYQGSPGSSISINANIKDGATPVLGATVDFSIMLNDILTPIGSATTNSGGNAIIFYLADLDPGNYSIYAEATYQTQYGIINSELSLSQPSANWSNLNADAEFGSTGFGITSVTISGTLKTQGGNPIVDTPVEIRGDNSLFSTVLSDSSGDFSYTYQVNFVVGTYTDYYSINITDGFWNAAPESIDLIISRGQLFINTDDVSSEFIDQPTHITGAITNTPGEDVISTINLDRETTPGVWTVIETVFSDNFDFTLQTQSAGSYNYRVRVDETAQWISVLQPVSVNIGASNAAISRGGLLTTFDIRYHQNYDLSVYVLKDDLSAIENADMKITVWDPVVGANVEIANGLTDGSGLVILYWIPEDSYLSLPGLSIPLTYTATHNDFVITQLQVFFTIVSNDVSLSLVDNTWTYDTNNIIEFDTVDEFGYVVNQGTQFDITIEGTSYTMTIDALGHGTVTHRFANVGSASMSITTTITNPFPYNDYSDTLLYSINKGDYIITGSDEFAARGENYQFSSTITDHNGIQLSNPVVINLWLFDVTWINLAQISTINDAVIHADIVLNEGVYTIEWRVDGNNLYNGASLAYLLTVDKSITKITFTQVPTSYNFNDDNVNREVSLLLQVPILDEVLPNQFISIDFSSVDDSYSWFLQTDVAGIIKFTLPQQPITGSYTLTVTFIENIDYLSTNSITSIDVFGVDTILSWKMLPKDGFYAVDQLFSVHAEDTLGNYLIGFSIDLIIGPDTFSVLTNSTGDATFNINMIYEGTVDLNVVLQAKDGWNSQSIDITIQMEKKQLAITSEINSIMYSPTNDNQNLDFVILVNSYNDPFLVNIKLELYWLNPTSGQFEFVDIYYTDNSGYLYVTLSFPTIDASQSYVFNWLASDADFISYQLDQFYSVTPMSLDVTISYGSGNYLESTPIDFTIRDSDGLLISDLDVYMSYTETIILWSESDTTSFGTSIINFYAPSVGDLSVYYRISDINGNYLLVDENILITINPTMIILNYSLDDDQGVVTLLVDVRNPANEVITEGMVVIESWQGSWVTEKTLSLSQTNSYILNLYSDSMQFRLTYVANSHYSNSELVFDLYRQDLTVLISPFEMEVSNDLQINIELQGNSSLNGYLVEIHIYDEITGQWTNDRNLYTSDGFINETIPVNLDIGAYQIRIMIAEQGWYRLYNQVFNLDITLNHFLFVIDNDLFRSGVNNYIGVSINSSTPNAVNNVQLDLFIQVDNVRTHIGTVFTDNFGNATFIFNIIQPYGEYSFTIVSTQTLQIKLSSIDFQGIIGYNVNADFIITDEIDYNRGGTISVLLTDHVNQLLINSQVDVFYSLFDPVSQSYLEQQFITTIYSNSSGFILIDIPAIILMSDNIRISISLSDQLIIGNSMFSHDLTISKSTPFISYQIDDFGVSQYAKIRVIVVNINNNSLGGDITWKLNSGSQETIIDGSGNLEMVDGIYQFSFDIPAVYIGEYLIVLDFHDTNTLQKYLDTSTIFYFGWAKADTTAEFMTPNIVYQSAYNISFVVSDQLYLQPLLGIEISITIDTKSYYGFTDSSGMVILQLDIIPGVYNINLAIDSSYLINGFDFTYELEILRGNAELTLHSPGNYSQIASSVSMNLFDSISYDDFSENYNVTIFRDNLLLTDIAWDFSHGSIIIYPTNGIPHLYPGPYHIELLRYHPYYTNSTTSQDFIISPMYVEFNYKIENINGTEYLLISYPDNTVLEIEFTTRLSNTDLSDEVYYFNTDLIMIPWDKGAIIILIEGTGYIGGRATGTHDISTTVSNSTSSITNSTGNYDDTNFGSFMSIKSAQIIGGIVLFSSIAIPSARQYFKSRK